MFDTNFRIADIAATTMTSRHASQGHEAIIVQTSWALFQKASRQGWMRRAWAAIGVVLVHTDGWHQSCNALKGGLADAHRDEAQRFQELALAFHEQGVEGEGGFA